MQERERERERESFDLSNYARKGFVLREKLDGVAGEEDTETESNCVYEGKRKSRGLVSLALN